MFSYGFHCGHVQRNGEGGDAQLETVFVGVNPEVVTPDGGVGAAPTVLQGDLPMQLRGGGALQATSRQQGRDPPFLNL